jgi:hypothetical protein
MLPQTMDFSSLQKVFDIDRHTERQVGRQVGKQVARETVCKAVRSLFHQPICTMCKGSGKKVNSAKDVFLLYQHFCRHLIACFRLQLGCRAPYFGSFLPIAVAIIRIEIHFCKGCSALAHKNAGEIYPRAKCNKKFCL